MIRAIIMRQREGKPGGGKGPMLSDKSFTIATANDQTLFIFEATRVDDARFYEDYSPTVTRSWGTGGARVPYVCAIQGTMINREDKNGPGGKGFVEDGPMFTLTRTDVHAVSITPIQDARETEKQQNGIGIGQEGDPMFTLTRTDNHAVAFDTYNQTVSEMNQTLRAQASDNDHIGTVFKNSSVRRLTPLECERLQGFPDGWTEGQADTHRYKQMGNAVAVPVVQWIISRIKLEA